MLKGKLTVSKVGSGLQDGKVCPWPPGDDEDDGDEAEEDDEDDDEDDDEEDDDNDGAEGHWQFPGLPTTLLLKNSWTTLMKKIFGNILHFLCLIPQNLHRLVGKSRQLHNRPILGLVQSYICVSLTLLGNHLDKIVMAVAMNLCLDLLFLLLLLAITITITTLQKFSSKCIANISDKVVALILPVPPRLKGLHIKILNKFFTT